MNRLVALAALGSSLVVTSLFAQITPPSAPAAAPPPAPADAPAAPAAGLDAAFTADNRSEASVKAATELLSKVAESYRKAATTSDTVKIEVVTPMGPQNEQLSVDFGNDRDLRINLPGMTITSVDKMVYVEAEQFDGRFVGVPIKNDSVIETLGSVAEGFSLPLPHLDFRFGKESTDWMRGLSAGSLENLKVAGHRTNEAGQDEVLLTADNGKALATINATSRLLDKLAVDFAPAGAPPGMTVTVGFAFAPVVADALAKPIVFEKGDRKMVETFESLMSKLQVGDPAPTFELKDDAGGTVKLADLKGQVVVLDLWATWCGPCRKGLPLVDEFAKWAVENKKDIKVFGVNVWENNQQGAPMSVEDRTRKAVEFWSKQAFSFRTLIDTEEKVASDYSPNGIPTTYVIDTEGKIAHIHSGFDPETVKKLQTESEALLGAAKGQG